LRKSAKFSQEACGIFVKGEEKNLLVAIFHPTMQQDI